MFLATALQELPASLADASAFSTVRTIDLTSNKLTQLPPFLGSFSVLLRLTLSRNQLTQLPSEICHLTSLKVGYHLHVAQCFWWDDSPACCQQ